MSEMETSPSRDIRLYNFILEVFGAFSDFLECFISKDVLIGMLRDFLSHSDYCNPIRIRILDSFLEFLKRKDLMEVISCER